MGKDIDKMLKGAEPDAKVTTLSGADATTREDPERARRYRAAGQAGRCAGADADRPRHVSTATTTSSISRVRISRPSNWRRCWIGFPHSGNWS